MKIIKEMLKELIEKHGISDEQVSIKSKHDSQKVAAKTLTPEEAIGKPIHNDYPIITGVEKMMEATFKSSRGVAFTDHYGFFSGKLIEIIELPLENNFQRAVFISTLNAVLSEFDIISKTVHCRNDEMLDCADQVVDWIKSNFGEPVIFQVGLQPRLVEKLSEQFTVLITDRDEKNYGKKFNGTTVSDPVKSEEFIQQADLIFATGSIFTNNTYKHFYDKNKPLAIYGVTGAGIASLLKLPRFCPCGHE